MEPKNTLLIEQKKRDYILISLIIVSIILIGYASLYIINYYIEKDILVHYPSTSKNDGNFLEPNEVGDSIGGILNPIIGLTASILTFLAFYIQFKANNEQRRIYNNNLQKEKDIEINNHKINLRIFKNLFLSAISYFKESGIHIANFIENEKKEPLSPNTLSFITNSSYENFNKLDFKEIYSAIVYNFKDSKDDWEKEFTDVLTTMDFYEKMLVEIRQKYNQHLNAKVSNINSIGELINAEMSNVLSDNELKNFDGIDDYIKIVYNKLPNGEDSIPENEFEFPNINDLYSTFFDPFLKNLYVRFKETEESKYKKILDFFSHQRKRLGTEKIQAEKYAENLEAKYTKYFNNAEELRQVENFLEKLNFS